MSGERYSVNGKTVLITGAARGIGAESARRLARRGARVSLVGLEPEALAEVAKDCGPDAVWFEADVTDRAAVDAAVAGTVEQTGAIDVVIANAGIGGGGPVTLIDPDVFERVVRVNFFGVWNTLHACLPHVIERRGYMLPVASVAALTPQPPGMTPYAASKAAVEALAKGMRTELRHRGVTVGIAYFSWIETDMVAAAHEHRTFQFMRSRIRGPGSKTYPLTVAIDAIERGVEQRAETVVAPGWVKALIAFRGMVGPGIDRRLATVVPEAMKMAEEELAEAGKQAFMPGGAGGEADARAGGYGRGVATEPAEPDVSSVAEAAARGK